MKGVFIEGITVEMFRNATLEAVETLIAEGEVIDYDTEPKQGEWIQHR